MNTQTAVRVLSILLLLAPAARPGVAASFSAELVETQPGQTRTGSFNFQDKNYRFEIGESGQTLIVAVDGQSGKMRLLNSAEKAYYEAGPDEAMNLMANPFGAYAHFARTKDVKNEGTESIGGVPCQKQVVSGGGQVFVTAWVSEEFGFPLKVETTMPERTVELRNLKRGPQDAALFAVPAGFKLLTIEREPPPEWAKQVADAPVLTPPFEKTLAEGAIIRLRPQVGRAINLECTNPGKESSAFTSVTFKDGKPLEDVSMSTMNLEEGQTANALFKTTPAEADDIVVRVGRKEVTIKASFVAAPGAGPASTSSSPEPSPLPPGAAAEPATAVNAPSSAEIATQILVEWMGAGNPDDFVAVARPDQPAGASINRTFVREGSPLKLWMPSDPGEYEVRYILGKGKKLLAKSPISISAVTAKVEPAGPVNAAAWIAVKWEGPAREGDYISVARPDQNPGANAGLTPVKQGNPLKVRAPGDPGDYEVRYILARGVKVLAKAPLTINAVTADVKVPASAAVGAEIEVQWTGPGYPEDFISLARANQPPGASLNRWSVGKGSPLKIRVPKEPGTYEVRYVLGRGARPLAKTTITIPAP
jgi:hypothetical protein